MNNIEEFITYKGHIYKRMSETNSMLNVCPNCNKQYFTKEQRRIFCCDKCKMQFHRAKHYKKETGIINIFS